MVVMVVAVAVACYPRRGSDQVLPKQSPRFRSCQVLTVVIVSVVCYPRRGSDQVLPKQSPRSRSCQVLTVVIVVVAMVVIVVVVVVAVVVVVVVVSCPKFLACFRRCRRVLAVRLPLWLSFACFLLQQ